MRNIIKNVLRRFIEKLGFHVIKASIKKIDGYYIKPSKDWNVFIDKAVGGLFDAPNLSGGYHGILQQWWEYYGNIKGEWLLVAENAKVKKTFEKYYQPEKVRTLEKFSDLNQGANYSEDICSYNLKEIISERFDIVLCQATLEHVYAPFQSVKNCFDLLKKNGIVLIHTHTPGFMYHPWPRDTLRFHPDWFLDISEQLYGAKLLELYVSGYPNYHIFALFKKIEKN